MKIVAVDPGLSGAAAVLEKSNGAIALVSVIDLPTAGEGSKRRLDAPSFTNWLIDHAPLYAFVEAGRSMPKQGISGAFRYGRVCGAVEALVAARHIALIMVEPTVWKKYFRLKSSKEDARALAIQRLPSAATELQRHKDHNRAEALLIGIYGLENGIGA